MKGFPQEWLEKGKAFVSECMTLEEPVYSAIIYRWFLSIWTFCFFAPRFLHAEELYGRTILRDPVPFWKLIGDPVLPLPFLEVIVIVLGFALIAFALGFATRIFHLCILALLSLLFAQDMLMQRAYGVLAYIQWFYLFLAPYDHPPQENGNLSTAPKWRLFFLRLQFSSVYFFTVFAKTIEGKGWLDGSALYNIINSPRYGLWFLSQYGISENLAWVFSLGTLFSEIFIALGLWHRKTRGLAICVCLAMHLGMACTLRVSLLFHALMVGHLILFIPSLPGIKRIFAPWPALGKIPLER